MKYIAAAAFLVAIIFQNSCDSSQKKTPAPVKPMKATPLHRFVLAQPLKDVAFDTQTGQLCRTWEWSIEPSKANPATEIKVGQFAPTCLSVYTTYPTIGGSGSSVGDNDSN